jgi:hypothetical protein
MAEASDSSVYQESKPTRHTARASIPAAMPDDANSDAALLPINDPISAEATGEL